jgi:hypothetical protein
MRTAWLLLALGVARVAYGQAEPAPPGYVPPAHPTGATQAPTPPAGVAPREGSPAELVLDKPWYIGVGLRGDFRLGAGSDQLPQFGWGGVVEAERAIVHLGPLRFGIGAEFSYDRFAQDKLPAGTKITQSDVQFVSHSVFAAHLLLDLKFRWVRPWLHAGGGVSIAEYQNPSTTVGQAGTSVSEAVPLAFGAIGFGVAITPEMELGLRGELLLTFSRTTVEMPPLQPFEPGLVAAGGYLGFHF